MFEVLAYLRPLLLFLRDRGGDEGREILGSRRREGRAEDLLHVADVPPTTGSVRGCVDRDPCSKIEEPGRSVSDLRQEFLQHPVKFGSELSGLRGRRAGCVPFSPCHDFLRKRPPEGEAGSERAREVGPGTGQLRLDLGHSHRPRVGPRRRAGVLRTDRDRPVRPSPSLGDRDDRPSSCHHQVSRPEHLEREKNRLRFVGPAKSDLQEPFSRRVGDALDHRPFEEATKLAGEGSKFVGVGDGLGEERREPAGDEQ